MDKIVIVDAVSTGYNLVEDVRQRGFAPVVLNMTTDGEENTVMQNAVRPRIEGKCEFIDEQKSYSETLSLVRALHPKVVLAGDESGVVLATRLAEDLGLPGNPTSILPQITQKTEMHEALRRHGLRYIPGRIVKSPEEAAAFYDELGLHCVVVKHNGGAGSVGLHICENREEMLKAVSLELKHSAYYGNRLDNVILQELIRGDEYIVNTVTCQGRARMTSVFRSDRTVYPDGRRLYRTTESINTLRLEHAAIISYSYLAIKALGIQFGMVHGEYMVDENGPVLIEVNCRPMGLTMPAEYLQQMLVYHHDTDLHLDSYLYPDTFLKDVIRPYRPKNKLIIKTVTSNTNKELFASPILHIAPKLKSYYSANLSSAMEYQISKTIDLDTTCGTIYLSHQDEDLVRREASFLCKLEDVLPEMIYQDKEHSLSALPDSQSADNDPTPEKIAEILGFGDQYTLFSDKNGREIERGKDVYTNVIVDIRLNKFDWSLEDFLSACLCLTDSMKRGSTLVVTGKTLGAAYKGMTYASLGMMLSGMTIEAPLPDYPRLLIGTIPQD